MMSEEDRHQMMKQRAERKAKVTQDTGRTLKAGRRELVLFEPDPNDMLTCMTAAVSYVRILWRHTHIKVDKFRVTLTHIYLPCLLSILPLKPSVRKKTHKKKQREFFHPSYVHTHTYIHLSFLSSTYAFQSFRSGRSWSEPSRTTVNPTLPSLTVTLREAGRAKELTLTLSACFPQLLIALLTLQNYSQSFVIYRLR